MEGNFVATPGVLFGVVWLVLAIRRGYGPWTTAIGVVAVAHLAAVAAVTLFPLPVQAEVIEEFKAAQLAQNNIVPFASLVEAVSTGGCPSVISQSAGNFLMLVPFGFYAPMLVRRLRSFRSTMFAGLAFSLTVEAAQLAISSILGYTYKIADVDDVILNTAGVSVGYVAFLIGGRFFDDESSLEPPGRTA